MSSHLFFTLYDIKYGIFICEKREYQTKNISPRIIQLNKFKNKKDFGIALEVFFLP